MKLLFLTINLCGGGAERVLVNLVNNLVERGHSITVRSVIDQGDNRELLSPLVTYEYVFQKGFKGINYLYLLPHKWIYNKLCYGEYDIVIPYLHGMLTRVVSYAPKKQKTIAWLHADMKQSKFMQKLIKDNKVEECFCNYDLIAAVSETVKASFIEITGISENVVTCYNVFDIPRIIQSSEETVSLPFAKYHLVSVGKLERVKGYLRLLTVFNKLVKEDGLDLFLTIAGEGSERNGIEAFISNNHIQDRILLTGYDTNPYKYIANSDLFICSSYTEGFSSVVAESIILGTPVVSTDVSGAREMLGDSEYGIVVDNSEDGLYYGIKTCLGNMAYWKEKVKERSNFFSIDEVVGSTEKKFRGIL